jgi:hypothetical protein
MSNYTEEDVRDAHVDNMKADTDYKRGLLKYEPWKLLLTAMGAGAALTLAMLALLTWLAHR